MLRNPTFNGKVSRTLPLQTLPLHEMATGSVVDERSADALSQTRLPPSVPLSFEEVYRTFFDHVCRWTRALGGPDAERDDLVQDVFLIVHRRLPDFDGKNVSGWLYQITRHRVRDFRRLHWFRLFLSSSQADESLVSSAGGPEAELSEKQQADILSRLLTKLPETQRAAFVLFEVDGYSGEEIARIQTVPINTVWARIHKARAKLAANVSRLRRQR